MLRRPALLPLSPALRSNSNSQAWSGVSLCQASRRRRLLSYHLRHPPTASTKGPQRHDNRLDRRTSKRLARCDPLRRFTRDSPTEPTSFHHTRLYRLNFNSLPLPVALALPLPFQPRHWSVSLLSTVLRIPGSGPQPTALHQHRLPCFHAVPPSHLLRDALRTDACNSVLGSSREPNIPPPLPTDSRRHHILRIFSRIRDEARQVLGRPLRAAAFYLLSDAPAHRSRMLARVSSHKFKVRPLHNLLSYGCSLHRPLPTRLPLTRLREADKAGHSDRSQSAHRHFISPIFRRSRTHRLRFRAAKRLASPLFFLRPIACLRHLAPRLATVLPATSVGSGAYNSG